jgi:hypothetical protein
LRGGILIAAAGRGPEPACVTASIEGALEHDVEHTADGVPTVVRRCAVKQEVDTFDGRGGYMIEGSISTQAVALRWIAETVDHQQVCAPRVYGYPVGGG